jgi:AraC-like DNA-binding protein
MIVQRTPNGSLIEANRSPETDVASASRAVAPASDLMAGDPDVRTLPDAATRLRSSSRTLQRLATRYVGLAPVEMIRYRRLQEAAQRVRLEADASLVQIAAELGYADHAHLTREFRDRLGFTPSAYRRGV